MEGVSNSEALWTVLRDFYLFLLYINILAQFVVPFVNQIIGIAAS